MKQSISLPGLRRFNILMGALHFIQGLLMIFLGLRISRFTNFKLTITQHFLRFDTFTQSLVSDSKNLFTVPFFVLVASFLLISAIAHALISLPKKTNAIYNADLERGINKFRWFEYSLSSSIMIVLISYLFGIYDIASLILIFVVNACMNLFGLLMEQLNIGAKKENVKWGPFIWGSIAGLAPWIAIILYMTGAGKTVSEQTPWFVWAIVGTYFVAFNSFPINMIKQYMAKGKWANYLYGERNYIVLSLVAKTILAWLVLIGALQP